MLIGYTDNLSFCFFLQVSIKFYVVVLSIQSPVIMIVSVLGIILYTLTIALHTSY